MITRSQVIRNAATLWPTGTVPYSQDTIHGPTGYRQDCSGFVSMCWGIPRGAPGSWGGMNTVSLVTNGWMHEISPGDLAPGDAVGICGPGSAGDDGHIVLFERWASDAEDESRYWAYEQAGGQRGPVHRIIDYPYGGPTGAWRAYRFRDITDNAGGSMGFEEIDPTAGRRGRTYGQGISDSANMRDWWIGNGGLPAGFPTPTSPAAQLLAGATSARAALAELAALRLDLSAARAAIARLEARPAVSLTREQIVEIASEAASLIGAGISKTVGDMIAERMKA